MAVHLTLRRQLAMGTLATVLLPSLLVGWFVHRRLTEHLRSIEVQHAERELTRSANLLNLRLADLQRTVRDYAYWNAMYEFAGSPNPGFLKENASPSSVATLGAELWMVRDPAGRRLACLFVDRNAAASQPWTLGLEQLFSPASEFGRVSKGERRGLYLSRDEIWMVATAPILRSDRSGPPLGEFVMATRVGGWEARQLTESLRLQARFSPREPVKPKDAIDRGDGVWIALSGEQTVGCQPIRSPDGSVAGWIVVRLDRPFYREIASLLRLVAVALALMALGSTVCTSLWFSRRLVARLEGLRDAVAEVGHRPHGTIEVSESGHDEIGQIASSIASTVQDLTTFRAIVESVPALVLLLDSSRRCTYANAFAKTWLGEDPVAEGSTWEGLWSVEGDTELTDGAQGRACRGGEQPRVVWYHAARVVLDGEEVWLVTGFDATAQAEAERAAELARRALEVSPVPVFLLHPNGLIDWANGAARNLTGDGQLSPALLAAQFDDAFWVRAQQCEGSVEVSGRLAGASETELEGAAILLSTPNGPRVCAFLHDATLAKKAIRKLETREQKLRTVLEELAVGLLLLDDQGRIELSNRAAWELLGEGADSLVGTQLKDLPIRWQDDPEALLKRSRSIGVCSAECSVAAPGAERQLEATVFRVEEKFGVLFQDETERIKAQQALTEALQSSVDFQRLFDGIPEGALLLREDFTVRRCNQAWRDLSGWPEGLDRPFPEAFHESDRNQVRQALEECLRSATGQASVEARLRSPEGVLRWVVVVAAACREDSALLVCLHDVSAMRQDIQRLQRSLEHLERMGRAFDALPTYFAVADAGGRILLVNEALGRAVHDDPIEAIGGHLADLVAQGDRPAWREAIASVERTGATLRGFLARMETANGPTAWVSWQASFDADRGLLYASGTEVTLLAESRDRIAREAAELTEFFSGIREAVVVTDPKGLIRFWSQSAERVFGFGAKNALGRRIADLLATPEDAERLEVNFELSKACGQMDLTATCRTATGRTVEIEGNIRWRSAEAPNPMAIWVLRDVTAEVEERSRLSAAGSRLTQAEEALRESSNSIWSWSAQEPYEAEWCLGDCRALTGREAPCSLRSLVSGLDRDWLFERLSQCLAEEKPLLDATFRVKGAGELKWVRARFLLPGHHGQRSIRCVLGEITEWKRIEESVREQNRELERLRTLLEERNTILAQQTERLGASLRESESARRKFEAAAQRYRRFVDGLPVACVVCDAEGKVVEWNQSAERVFERRPHEAIGKELVRLLAQNPLEAHDWDDLVRRTLRGESWPAVERPFRKPSGSAGWVLVGAIGLTDLDGASSGALFACYDITSRKEEEAHREERILQVHELAAKLAETQAELDRLRGLLDDQRSDAA